MSANVSTHYISEKVSRVRWLPEQLLQSERFITGSWDMDRNFVRLWKLQSNQYATANTAAAADNVELMPRCMDKVSMEDDVTGMEFVDKDTLAVTTADGRLSLMNVQRAVEEDQMHLTARSEQLHSFQRSQEPAPCTDISVYGTDIATAGEDGCVNILSASNIRQVKRNIEADSLALFAVSFVSQNQLVAANRMGVIRMLDVRVASEAQPKVNFMVACKDDKSSNFVSSITSHPMQQHILLCGTEEGSITVWDLRNLEYPASYLNAHSSPITDIGFHRKDPSKLFTAAEAGEVWMWSENKVLTCDNPKDGSSAWLSGDRVKSLVGVEGVLTNIRKAINSFDVHGTRLVCGGDSEAVYLIDDIV
ncbi:nucleoporin Nup43 [Drosophila bipectinata]|uniref:nucleoporin Nup43 n=1 Tax=Drosophila bipectinata TaxID=42026 RepID=UPI0007E8A711|nr:nucleoporin Nup43 [Drosophila bipectinata]